MKLKASDRWLVQSVCGHKVAVLVGESVKVVRQCVLNSGSAQNKIIQQLETDRKLNLVSTRKYLRHSEEWKTEEWRSGASLFVNPGVEECSRRPRR